MFEELQREHYGWGPGTERAVIEDKITKVLIMWVLVMHCKNLGLISSEIGATDMFLLQI